jgi:hypothetical protein
MLIEGQTQKFLEGDPVVDLVFQLRVGIDPVPLLQEKPFQEDQRRIGAGTLVTGPNGIVSQKNFFHLGPVYDLADFLQPFEATVMFHGS